MPRTLLPPLPVLHHLMTHTYSLAGEEQTSRRSMEPAWTRGPVALCRTMYYVLASLEGDAAKAAFSGNDGVAARHKKLGRKTVVPIYVQVQLIMGKTLVDRMGEMEARVAMRGVKRGQLLYVTGRPTPDTRFRFSSTTATATSTTTAIAFPPAENASVNSDSGGGGGGAAPSNADTYDLVCCSLRMLEDAPLVDPELVGKGDGWTGGGDYLKMDLEEEAVTYVDSSRRLREMGKFLRETLLGPLATSGAGRNPRTAVLPALAVDCEWRPGRVAGRPENPDDSYDVPVDPKQQDKATTFKLTSFRRPHMRAFHFAWFGFFMAFVSWFAFAPLMKEIKKDLGMTTNEVYNANIASVSSTVLSRFIVGPLCDTFGARIISTTLLIMGSIPTFFGGLVNSAEDVAIIRFFIGVMGATFVCTQFWSSQIFVKEFVGTANATTGGWGNLGGGVTQIFMVGIWKLFQIGYDSETSWRLSFIVPAAIVLCVAIGQLFLADDCPKGNYKELEAHGAMTRKSSAVSFRKGYVNYNSWLLFCQYAACFGVELTVNNVAASYFSDEFDLSTSKAGIVASLFGLMNLFARSLGGIWSDFLYRRFGSGVTGMRGRFYAQWSALIWEAVFLFVFTQMNTIGPAIVVLILFSVGVQMAEGCTYGIVPYVCPEATGAVSGIVGAGGNFGAVMWGLIFRFGPSDQRTVFRIIAGIVLALSGLTPLLKIRGYASVLGAPKGEPDSIADI